MRLQVSKDMIRKIVEEQFELEDGASLEKTRRREVIEARHTGMRVIRDYTKETLHGTARYYGHMSGGSNATVLHAIKNSMNLYDTDPQYRLDYDAIIKAVEEKAQIVDKVKRMSREQLLTFIMQTL